MRKLKTTSEPLETTESALEMQQTGNTIILNPALHSAAGNLSGVPAGTTTEGGKAGASRHHPRSRTSKRPPALVLTKDSPMGAGAAAAYVPPGSGNSPGWKVTFPDIEIHSPKEEMAADNASISSRGTSSTVGYRYVFCIGSTVY